MKKAILAALIFVVVGFALVNGTFALPDFDDVFQVVTDLLEKGIPEMGGAGTAVDVALVSDNTPQQLYPGGSVSQTHAVRNDGTGSVYFRLVYAIQYDADSWDKLGIDFTAGADFVQHGWQDITVDGTPYKMMVFTYTDALAAGQMSSAVTLNISMDTAFTSEELNRYRGDFLQTQVLAIDPTPFTEKGYITAEDALNLALPLDTLNPF